MKCLVCESPTDVDSGRVRFRSITAPKGMCPGCYRCMSSLVKAKDVPWIDVVSKYVKRFDERLPGEEVLLWETDETPKKEKPLKERELTKSEKHLKELAESEERRKKFVWNSLDDTEKRRLSMSFLDPKLPYRTAEELMLAFFDARSKLNGTEQQRLEERFQFRITHWDYGNTAPKEKPRKRWCEYHAAVSEEGGEKSWTCTAHDQLFQCPYESLSDAREWCLDVEAPWPINPTLAGSLAEMAQRSMEAIKAGRVKPIQDVIQEAPKELGVSLAGVPIVGNKCMVTTPNYVDARQLANHYCAHLEP